ncbi:MAG: hypothetical protein K1X28_02950 [Parachlamydiales bacterium]|nr:hypothetical protein [Parachlamydiales bacterium]
MNTNSGAFVRLSDRLIEYQLDGDTYAVVVVMDGISSAEAKRMAKQRAAEITVMQGERYFTVDSMYETEVIKSDEDMTQQSQRFYGNMYQELIIEGDFNRERLRYRGVPETNTYPAVRMQFTMYKDRPSFKAIDACTLTNCNQ